MNARTHQGWRTIALFISPLNVPLHAGLLSLDVTNNSLHSLPAQLTSQPLTRLTLGGNSELSLTRADVDMLARFPRLQQLELWSTATPNDVIKYAARKLSQRAE